MRRARVDAADRGGHKGAGGSALFWLSFAAGCTDVLSFLKLGNVFTSAMTGNTALLAIAIGRGQLVDALHSLCALVAFSLGVAIATWVYAQQRSEEDVHRSFRRLLLLELFFLGGCAALWSTGPDPLRGGLLYAVIALSALSMGIQAVGAHAAGAAGISTIVFTTVLIRIVMSMTAAAVRPGAPSAGRTDIRPHLSTFGAYGCGGVLAAFFVSRYLGVLIWIPFGAVVLALGSSELARKAEA